MNIVIATILILVLLVIYRYMNARIEHLKDSTRTHIIDKEIYLKHKSGIDKYLYLSVSPRTKCDNIKKSDLFECLRNIAILREDKSKFCKFMIKVVPDSEPARYTVHSVDENVTPREAKLSQNVNYMKIKGFENATVPACFDNGRSDVVQLEIVEDKNTLKLVFRKKIKEIYENYYVGLCPSTCRQGTTTYKRLCVYKDPKKAISFEVE